MSESIFRKEPSGFSANDAEVLPLHELATHARKASKEGAELSEQVRKVLATRNHNESFLKPQHRKYEEIFFMRNPRKANAA